MANIKVKAAKLSASLKIRNEELQILKENRETSKEEVILIRGHGNDIELRLNPQDLIYLKADGNYLEVFFYNRKVIQKKLIRSSLRSIAEVLPRNSFIRCHKSFIINGNHIISVEGNARNLTLYLKNITMGIPVSRSRVKAISVFLENLSKL